MHTLKLPVSARHMNPTRSVTPRGASRPQSARSASSATQIRLGIVVGRRGRSDTARDLIWVVQNLRFGGRGEDFRLGVDWHLC